MRSYETAFLIAPTLPEEEMEKLIDKMAGIISKKKGKMIHLDKWGKRKLAYPIEKFSDAYYVFFQFKGEPDIPAELERNFKQTEAVIRYLTVKMEERANVRRKKEKTRGKRPGEFEEPAREEPAPKGSPVVEEEPAKKVEEEKVKEGPQDKGSAEKIEEETPEEVKKEKKNG
jgi:small subunit ribosomal protein S6